MADKKEAPKKPTKADYQEAAVGLSMSLAIQLCTPGVVEDWLAHTATYLPLEYELVAAAWERLRAMRERAGECIDCGGKYSHDRRCPQYKEL